MNSSALEKMCLNLVDRQLKRINTGHLIIRLPDGEEKHYGDQSEPRTIIIRNNRFFPRLVQGGNVGLGEAWTDGDWDSDDLTSVLRLFVDNMEALKATGIATGLIKRFQHLLRHTLNRNTLAGSKRNIHAHYDLGNDFYRLFLDAETMMYSSALFTRSDEPLDQAQLNKIHRLIELAGIQREHHVLEIGCGWGGFAVEAARRTGCRVTGITISEEQFNYACGRVADEELQDRIDIVLCDYREIRGQFDRIVSIEMLEAVGHAYYGTFFDTCDRLLYPGGCAVLQVITIPDQRYDTYRRNPDWIQKHIFPGGMLPSLNALSKAMTRHSRFTIEHLDNIGLHYAETLRRWRKSFEAHRAQLLEMGYDEAFQRKWIYYLCYCEAGFQTRFINDLHLVIARPAEPTI